MNALIRWSIEHRLLVVAASLLLLIVGLDVTRNMPVDVFPDLTAPTVTVVTVPPSASFSSMARTRAYHSS